MNCKHQGIAKAAANKVTDPRILKRLAAAADRLERVSFQAARKSDTVAAFSIFLKEFPYRHYAKEARAMIKGLRCRDATLKKDFPSWLKNGRRYKIQASSTSIRSYIYGDKYLGKPPPPSPGASRWR